jgi:alpha-galactosidase
MKSAKSLFAFLCVFHAFSIQAVEYIPVMTNNICLMLKVSENNRLEQTYFGQKIKNVPELEGADLETFAAYSTFGTNHVFGAALQAAQSDGNTSTELVFLSSAVEKKDNIVHTAISLKDSYYPFFVTIHYNAYQQEDIIEQWVEIRNEQKNSVRLANFASSDLSFNASDYYVTHFHGDWAYEMNMSEQKLTEGIKIVDSKLGVRTNQFTHPCFLLSLNRAMEENEGEVVGGTLAWSGNFQFYFEVDNQHKLRVLSGANPYASEYTLEKNETLKTPAFLFSYSAEGSGKISRNFNRWALKYGIKNGNRSRDIILNNWEATYFDFNEEKLVKIFDDASKMGFELFLLDDGWFGNKYPRNNDKAGLGDWQTNKNKLPRGIPFLIEECHKRNLKFGIWVEPEMVNPKSELYEKHPDWVITQPHRDMSLRRSQLILDLTNPKVQDFVFETIDNILRENPGIEYVKWDCNRYITNSGSPYLPPGKQPHLFFDYAQKLLDILAKVAAKYPDVTFMACSGGGGRIDYGSMKYFDEYWISDNGDPLQRIFIQWGAQYFFPAVGLASHVSASPSHIAGRETPLKFRFDVAMSAKLGMDLQPAQMTEKEYQFSQKALQTYKDIRETVLHGDLYRILSPYKNNRTVYMYVNGGKTEAIVFNFLIRSEVSPHYPVVLLQGLDPDKKYRLEEINRVQEGRSRFGKYEGKVFSGEYLMKVGLNFAMRGEYESLVIRLKEIE